MGREKEREKKRESARARMHAGERVPEKALWLLLLCFFFQSSSNERQGKSKCVNKTTKENVAGGFETGEY